MRKVWIALLLFVPCLFARGGEAQCKEVSGGLLLTSSMKVVWLMAKVS